MALRKPEEYIESIEKLKPKVYLDGKRIENILENPVIKTTIETNAKIYELSLNPEYQEIMTATSRLTGEKINRITHVAQNTKDLMRRIEMAILTSQKTGNCNYRCPGCAFLSPLASTTWEMDKKLGTEYNKRFNKYLRYVQDNDLVCSAALVDPRGDRSRRPLEQDPDMYLHVVERRRDGIVIRGAKPHVTAPYASHEHIVAVSLLCEKGEEDYAVVCAVPNGAEGITYICQFTPYTVERIMAEDICRLGNPIYGQHESAMIVFDNVFVPWERVFICGEIEFFTSFSERLYRAHTPNCGGCKVGLADLIIGAAYLIMEYTGLQDFPHIQDNIVDMVRSIEMSHACCIAAVVKGREEPVGSGVYLPDRIFGSVGKINASSSFWEMMRLATDIAGGLVSTMPSEKELQNPDTKEYIKKYLKCNASAEKRMRITKFMQHWVAGLYGVIALHGGGSPFAHRQMLYGSIDFGAKKKLAKDLAGIKE